MFQCGSCGKQVFENLPVTASAIVVEDGKLLLVRRATNPQKGMLDIPGGYCNQGEHPEQSCLRELMEELGVAGEIIGLHGIYGPTPYEYQGELHTNCDIFYNVRLLSHDLKPMDDVASVEWVSLDALPADEELAFVSLQQALRAWR